MTNPHARRARFRVCTIFIEFEKPNLPVSVVQSGVSASHILSHFEGAKTRFETSDVQLDVITRLASVHCGDIAGISSVSSSISGTCTSLPSRRPVLISIDLTISINFFVCGDPYMYMYNANGG